MDEWKINQMIEEIYESKRSGNPAYSIRAFSRDLGLNDSTLSKIIKRKRLVGKNLALKLEKKTSS